MGSSRPKLVKKPVTDISDLSIWNFDGSSTGQSEGKFSDVFVHLIRNSLDHGIEIPSVRQAKGKDATGSLNIEFKVRERELEIRFSDDGAGLNLGVIGKLSREKGLLAEDEENIEKIASSIFSQGFSTAQKATEISGRGVGMDAVRSFLEKHNCRVELQIVTDAPVTKTDTVPIEFVVTISEEFYDQKNA